MAVVVETYTEALRTDISSPYTFSHAGVNPEGVLVGAIHGTSSTDHISAVSYGALALQRKQRNTDTATEPGAAEWWASPDGATIPPGTQTVSVTCGTTTDDLLFCCITLTADTQLQTIDVDGINENATNPSVTLQYGGVQGMAFAALYSGLTSHGSGVLAGGTGVTKLTADAQELAGNFTGAFFRQTTGGTSDFTIAVTAAADDVAYAAIAIGEMAARSMTGKKTQPLGGRRVTGRRYASFSRADTALAAGVSVSVASAGALTTAIPLAASPSVSITTAGALATAIRLATSPALSVMTAAALTTDIQVAGAVTVSCTATGTVTTAIPLAGSVSIGATTVGELTARVRLTQPLGGRRQTGRRYGPFARTVVNDTALDGAATLSATATGALTTAIPIAGAVVSSMATAAALTTAIRLTAAVSVGLTASGELTARVRLTQPLGGRRQTGRRYGPFARAAVADTALAGAAVLSASTAGALTTSILFAGFAALSARTTGTLSTGLPIGKRTQPLGGEGLTGRRYGGFARTPDVDTTLYSGVTVSIAATASLTTAIPLAGAVPVSITTAAALTTAIRLAGAVTASLTTSGALTTAIQMAAAVSATTQTAGALTTAIQFAGAVSTSITTSASLTAGSGLNSSVTVSAQAAAALTTQITLAASPAVSLATAGALTTAIRFAGASTLSALAAADLTTAIRFAGSGAVSITSSAPLTTAIWLAASPSVSTQTSAALTTQITLAGTCLCSVVALANFTTIGKVGVPFDVEMTFSGRLSHEVGCPMRHTVTAVFSKTVSQSALTV